MSVKKMPLDLENGGEAVGRRTDSKRSCFWQSLCAVAVLGLLAVSSYLLLCQLGVPPSNQEVSLNSEISQSQDLMNHSTVTTVSVNTSLPRLMKQLGNDPRGKIAAHLTASKTLKGEKVIWQDLVDSTFVERVEFRDNRFIIKTPGQYFVYTQVVFYSGDCQGNSIFLSHELVKFSPSYPEEALLLKAIKSACQYGPRTETWYKTSYQGAVFEFEAGDQIFSRVSEKSVGYVDASQGKSFFGIFAL
uniref:tumor necrosis factor-like n=1 Tax=Pristiophorus japonicus TaxID=55135 RepID=UPI00398EA99C